VLDDRIIAEYLRRSYFSVDGLWFVKVEEQHGFDEALQLDVEVWRILAKIQARKACELLNLKTRTLTDLAAALALKFAAEQYEYRVVSQAPDKVEIEIAACPWLELLEKSGRSHLSAQVAEAICPTDFTAWAKEFDKGIAVSLPERMCNGEHGCRLLLKVSG